MRSWSMVEAVVQWWKGRTIQLQKVEKDSSRMNTCTLHPLLEYPEILRYFDHSEMVPG